MNLHTRRECILHQCFHPAPTHTPSTPRLVRWCPSGMHIHRIAVEYTEIISPQTGNQNV